MQRVGVFFVEFSDKKMNGRTSSLRRRIVVLAKFDQEEGGEPLTKEQTVSFLAALL
ncbi:predicted protein [Enterococcus gallinarum EG2]|nr:predicted protein [Enterococcus gallinarum EG2]